MQKENSEKTFCFSGNCICICFYKLSGLRREHFLSAANVLTKSRKIFHINKKDFCRLNCLRTDQ